MAPLLAAGGATELRLAPDVGLGLVIESEVFGSAFRGRRCDAEQGSEFDFGIGLGFTLRNGSASCGRRWDVVHVTSAFCVATCDTPLYFHQVAQPVCRLQHNSGMGHGEVKSGYTRAGPWQVETVVAQVLGRLSSCIVLKAAP